MSQKDPALLRTQFTAQAHGFAATFSASLGKMRLAPANYVPELTVPEGQSTGGGAQALQRLRLVPQMPGYPTLVIGGVNQKEGTAELRTYEHVDAIHRQRFKRPVPLERAAYEGFLGMASNFFGVMRLRVTMVPAPAVLEASSPDVPAVRPSGGGGGVIVAIVALLLAAAVIAAVVVWLFVLKK
jgi:hypothetical protein